MSNQHSLKAWWAAVRPRTLTAAVVPVLVGTTLAYSTTHSVQWGLSALALVISILIQIGTNFINDAEDFKRGADTSERLGPQRMTQSGLLTAKQVKRMGLSCFALAVVLGIPLVWAGGLPILAIGIFSLLAGYAYTAGPFPLAYHGLGDFFVLLFFGWIAVCGTYLINTGSLNGSALIAGTQIGFLATVLIAVNNLRDSQTDRRAQKKTLAVRFGSQFVRTEITILLLAPFFGALYWLEAGLRWASTLPLLLFPMALALVNAIYQTEPSRIYNRFLARSALVHLGFGILLSIGFLLN